MSDGNLHIQIVRLPGNEDLPLPKYQSEHAAGMDLLAAVKESTAISPGQILAVPCGFCVAIPEGFEGQIRPRSGLALKHGVTIVNSPGTIDADYRGEVILLLINHGSLPFQIDRGMRIGQMLVTPVERVVWSEVSSLPASGRGIGGFGHTGT